MARGNPLFKVLKGKKVRYDADEITTLFGLLSEQRVEGLAGELAGYIATNLPSVLEKRSGLRDYRTNPYVLVTAASVMNLDDPRRFAEFLFNSKLYMSLETSFGKSVESILVAPYPMFSDRKWREAPECLAEFDALKGLSREEKARKRTSSAWREIDKSVVVGNTRYMTTIKSGPNTINDTQVQAMTRAIGEHHGTWMEGTRASHPDVENLDIVVGLTYGTPRSTNNKDNQILAKLLDYGFEEEDREQRPGVLIDSETRRIRVYRRIGRDFWAFIGNPARPSDAEHVFLEILLALAKALSVGMEEAALEEAINRKVDDLIRALSEMRLPRQSLPEWVREDFTADELFWFATALTSFYDSGG